MLERLELGNVGPAPEMVVDFASRVNLLTGDNGLGKSFLLDVVWWALTHRWPRDVNRKMTSGHPARPHRRDFPSTIRFCVRGPEGPSDWEASYVHANEVWTVSTRYSENPVPSALIVYAHSDGSFSVWDPSRNRSLWEGPAVLNGRERPAAYVFTEAEVWDGLRDSVEGRSVPFCNGLLYDWSRWIQANDDNARLMATALRALSPGTNPDHAMRPGAPIRVSVNDSRDIPTIVTHYANQIPITHASSGIRRIVALAYMLIWSWSEHQIISKMREYPLARQLVMLVDEVESHLHPRWQRTILRSLQALGSVLESDINLQLVVSTHSPLVLASAEPWFDPGKDAWFDLELEGDPPRARLYRRHYTPHGTAGSWLTSEAFNLPTDRSLEAEQAILHAREICRRAKPPLEEVMAVHAELRAALPDIDRFWVRWNAFVESRGGTP